MRIDKTIGSIGGIFILAGIGSMLFLPGEKKWNKDADIRKVLMQLINGTYSPQDPELFRDLYNSLLNTHSTHYADTYFILADFRSYAEAQKKIMEYYKNRSAWAKSAILNTAHSGKFSSDRTIQEYVDDIWHLPKVKVDVE